MLVIDSNVNHSKNLSTQLLCPRHCFLI